jgi:MSHA pilin protein MshC
MFIDAKNRGFTLVELVTVILLLGILSVVALPRFFDTTTFTSRGFYDEMTGAVRYAQKLAVASGCDVRLSMVNSVPGVDGSYTLHQRVACDHITAFNRDVLQPAGSGAFAGSAPSGTTLSSTSPSVIFDALGRATPGGVIVTVNGRTFNIVGESGYVDTP